MEKHYLGVDIGGTAVKLGVVDAFGHVGIMDEVSVSFDNYQTPIMDTVSGAIDRFLQKNDIEKAQLAGVGVSATGQVDSAKGLVAGTCGNLPGWSITISRLYIFTARLPLSRISDLYLSSSSMPVCDILLLCTVRPGLKLCSAVS